MRQRLYVYMDEQGLVGQLDFNLDGMRQSSVFTYAQSWIESQEGYDLSPFMPRGHIFAYASLHGNSSPLVMPIADSTPDSWGRAIMRAANGGRAMNDFDYLIEVDDFLRSGALRFYGSDAPDALPLAQPRTGENAYSIPRLIELETMIHEARALEADPAHYRENRAKLLAGQILRDAAGSLGGARPKVNVREEDRTIWIAKLPKMGDEYDMARAEVLTLRLAGELGMTVAESKLFVVAGQFPVALIKRFDRSYDGARNPRRIHFITAQTFMGLAGTEPSNYASIAEQMMISGAVDDLPELWTRMAYSVLIQNTDDHLRNHGFIRMGNRWALSPAYDINPDPSVGGTLKTAISDIHGNELKISAVLDAAPLFNIDTDEAREALRVMAEIIRDRWRPLASELGMTAKDIKALVPAFESPQVKAALNL
ncbi:type II toxin-antitoxin system HipA family toxin [Yersinia proxima]|uniref:type II toxin-antitoxin system HipA family toxin n=1 Tax=Yersinia proxima TaxID=2890316 RepID=UPI0009863101|nr:type II toxin-antitoxin system HipA family toxin [Yersinia proxima]